MHSTRVRGPENERHGCGWCGGLPRRSAFTVSSTVVRIPLEPFMIDLSANENPLGPCPRVARAIVAALPALHRYPDKDGRAVTAALARRLGVDASWIVLGNGSCEVLELAVRAHLAPGDEAILSRPGFAPYHAAIARSRGCEVALPLRRDRHDLAAMLDRVGDRTRLVILGNPHNPTGTVVARAEIERFLDRLPEAVTVILDEAYVDYAGGEDFADAVAFVREGRAVLATRSLSKAYGLAGLRFGYGVGAASTVRAIHALRQHYNVNALAQVAAVAALDDPEHLRRSVEHNTAARRSLHRDIGRLGLACVESRANFILVRVRDGAALCRRLEQRGLRVKDMTGFGLPDAIRVSVGSDEDNRSFIAALGVILGQSDASGERRMSAERLAELPNSI